MDKSITAIQSGNSAVVYALPEARRLADVWPGAYRPQQCLDALKRRLAVADPDRLDIIERRLLEQCLEQAGALLHSAAQLADLAIARGGVR